MYNELKNMMPHSDYFYGPVTKDVAFNVPFHSYAVPIGDKWYIGVDREIPDYQNLAISRPPESETAPPTP